MFDFRLVNLCRRLGLLALLVCIAIVNGAVADDGEHLENATSPNGKYRVVNVPYKEEGKRSPYTRSHFEIRDASGAELYSSGGEAEEDGPFSLQAYTALWSPDSKLVAIVTMWEKGLSSTILFAVRGRKAVQVPLPDYEPWRQTRNAVFPVKWINQRVLRLRVVASTGGAYAKVREFFSTVRITEEPWDGSEVSRTKPLYDDYGPE